MYRPSLLALALAPLFAGPAGADSPVTQPTVTVTATRSAETTSGMLAAVDVVTRADIEQSGAGDIVELLRRLPGIDAVQSGGAGGQTSLFLRGGNSNHVLVLVDGVRIASANTGSVDFSQWPLDAIERIEIVRGPRAGWWGADAIGGVIQIFTRRLDRARVALRAGSYGEAAGSAGYGAWSEAGGFSVQAGLRHVRGFSATNPGVCNGPDDPFCSYDPDDDGYRNRNLVARGALALGGQSLSARLLHSNGENEFDQGRTRVLEQVAGADLDGELAPGWSHHLSLGHVHESLRTPAFFTLFTSRRGSLGWLNTFALAGDRKLTAGIDLQHEDGENRDLYAGRVQYGDRRDNAALFAGWQGTQGDWRTEASARVDANSEFGRHGSGSLALGYDLAPDWRLSASYASAFRGPNLNEQFSPGYGGLFAGNPDLDPETSRTAELGLAWLPASGQRVDLRAYSTHIRDLIAFSGPQYRAENIDRARLDGVELAWSGRIDGWRWSANATWQNPRNEDTGHILLRRARLKANASLDREFGNGWQAGTDLAWTGRRTDIARELGGYALIGLHASWQANAAWRLTLRAENLTDRPYELLAGYNTPGRSGSIELVWQPE